MTDDKVNPTGQIDSEQQQHTKIYSILIVWLFVLTGKHWHRQSKSYSKFEKKNCSPANPDIHSCVSDRIYVMLKKFAFLLLYRNPSVDICQERSVCVVASFFIQFSKLEFDRLSFSTFSRTWKRIFNENKKKTD